MNEIPDSKIPWAWVGIALGLIGLFLVTAPWWQEFVLVGYISFAFVAVLLVGVIGYVFIKSIYTAAAVGAGSMIILAVLLLFSGAFADKALITDINPTQLTELPPTDDIRYLPLEMANAITTGTMKDPRFKPGETHPFDYKGEMAYITPRIPNGFNNWLNGNADGAMVIDSAGTQKIINQTFKYGEGMTITDNVMWQLRKMHYLSYIPDVYYVIDENTSELLIMAPYIGFEYHFPVMMVPYWKGVMVVHPDGEIEDLTPENAIADPRFKGQRLYPEYLARQIGDAWKYRNGIQNTISLIGTHTDQAELADVADVGNRMPYYMPVGDGFSWVSVFKPYGVSDSIYKVMYIDAHNGNISMYDIPLEQNLGGPARAISYVKTKFLQYDWENSAAAIEPLPTIVKKNIYYKVSVTNKAFNGLQTTVLVDSKINLNDNEQVLEFATYGELKAFLNGMGKYSDKSQKGSTHESIAMSNSDDKLLIDAIALLTEYQNRRKAVA